MSGKISDFGTLTQRGPGPRSRQGTRHVFAAVTVDGISCERPGVVLEWAREDKTWWARIAYAATDEGMLVVDWLPARQLTPVPPPADHLR